MLVVVRREKNEVIRNLFKLGACVVLCLAAITGFLWLEGGQQFSVTSVALATEQVPNPNQVSNPLGLPMVDAQGRTLVGYHGTTSEHLPSLLQAIQPQVNSAAELGPGFYVANDPTVAQMYGDMRAMERMMQSEGTLMPEGKVMAVYADDFNKMKGVGVLGTAYGNVADDLLPGSPLINELDYLQAPLGQGGAIQTKFNPPSFNKLAVCDLFGPRGSQGGFIRLGYAGNLALGAVGVSMSAADIYQGYRTDGNQFGSNAQAATGRQAGSWVGGALGGAGGGFAGGAAAGLVCGPGAPVCSTVLAAGGALVGGFAGGVYGSALGESVVRFGQHMSRP
jgi:hypothetical protein